MGLLDDAIREHLELKRRRGADPGEVARQEDEALGDPRNPEPAAAAAPPVAGDEPELEVPEFAAAVPAADLEPGPVPEAETELADPPEPPAAIAAEPEAAPPEPPAPRDEAWLDEEDEAPPVPAAAEPVPAEPAAPGDQPAGDDDVLEETPDFLQETPEHDRLWFEQKPPRDFDFDS
jgi:hypothetical protein